MQFTVRRMTCADIPSGMELKAYAGWNQTETDWRVFLDTSAEGCFAAECDGHVVGTTTTLCYGRSLAWIGMVLVHPDYRGRGIATRLMQTALDHLAECPTIKLDATAAGKKVYEKFEFVEESMTYRMTAPGLGAVEGPTDPVAPVVVADFDQIASMDYRYFGADRGFLLAALNKNTPDLAWHLARQGRTVGYCFGRHGSRFSQVGPLVAETPEAAVQLARAAMQSLTGRAVVLDVPAIHTDLIAWLETVGFSRQREFVRMVRGRKGPSDGMACQLAVCGPEFG